MKRSLLFLAIVSLILAGCRYIAPLTTRHNIPIDPAVLGLWESVDQDGAVDPDPDKRMVILKFSNTEYLIHYDHVFYRGYNIKVGKVSCVQVQVIGNDYGPVGEAMGSYDVVTYGLKNDVLAFQTLNSKKVSEKLKTSAALRRAFLKHQNDKDLFGGKTRFIRFDRHPARLKPKSRHDGATNL